MNIFRHLFTPHYTNNYRAKVLSHSFLAVFVVAFLVFSVTIVIGRQTHPEVLGISYSISETDLLADTNKERVAKGMSPLTLSLELNDAARRKASFMFEKNFWAHFAPDGTTPWSFIKSSGYEYVFAGENLAKGFTSSQDVVNAWMNSPSHKENLLSPKYKDVGFAIQEGNLTGEDTVLVVQMFGAPYVTITDGTSVQGSPPSSQIASENIEAQKPEQQVSATQHEVINPVVNTPSVTKSFSIVFLVFIITMLILDLVIVERKKIPRIVGHNLDHIIILVLFLVFILLEKSGGIL